MNKKSTNEGGGDRRAVLCCVVCCVLCAPCNEVSQADRMDARLLFMRCSSGVT